MKQRPCLTWFVAAALLLVLSACTTPYVWQDDKLASVATLERIFARLGAGFGKDNNRKAWVRKWVSPIRVELVNQQSDDDARLVREAMNKVVPYTGIPVEFPPKTGGTNFHVRFVKRQELKDEIQKRLQGEEGLSELPEGTVCFALPRGLNNIGYADIFVAYDGGEQLRDACIIHETMHALGLIGHHKAFGPSALFLHNLGQQEFSLNDRILLRTLYDPLIEPGMNHDEAIEIAKGLITGFREKLGRTNMAEDVLHQPLQW